MPETALRASAVQQVVPTPNGPQRVVLGLNSLADYIAHSPSFGAVPGRFANRIANGRFTLDGNVHVLDVKPGEKHTLHYEPPLKVGGRIVFTCIFASSAGKTQWICLSRPQYGKM